MSITRSVSYSNSIKQQEMRLPEEMLIKTLSFLDFDTLQKTCTRVSKLWFGVIRNSTELSGEMRLKTNYIIPGIERPVFVEKHIIGVKDINAVLSNWKKLRVLYVNNEKDIMQFGINLTLHELLEKIVVSHTIYLEKLDKWAWVKKFWFDPKQFWTPAKLENVMALKIDLRFDENFPTDTTWDTIENEMKNLEELVIIGDLTKSKLEYSFYPKHLKKIGFDLVVRSDDLLEILEIIGSINQLVVSGSIFVSHRLNTERAKNLFETAIEIIEENFTKKPTSFFVIDLRDPDVYFTFDGFTAKFAQERINYWDITHQPDLLLNLLATNATDTHTDSDDNEENSDTEAMNYYYNDDTDDYSDNEESSESDTEAMSGSDENSGTEVEDMNNSDENSDMLDY